MNTLFRYITAALMSISILSGCTKSFEEVNTDPDSPTPENVSSTNVLAFCERYASDNMFDEWFDLNESCGFSGQIAKWMYCDEGYYLFRPNVNSTSWNICYRTASNLSTIINNESSKGEVDQNLNMLAAAIIFRAQIFQIATDRWGNIPFFEACMLGDAENPIAQPVYDSQEEIYSTLLQDLKFAVELLDEDGGELGSGDVLLGGDITAWKKYGNALRLRMAARMAKKNPTGAAAVFSEILSDLDTYPIPEGNEDNVFFTEWGGEYPEPWADYYNSRKLEYGISKLMVDTFYNLDDPRIEVYAKPTAEWSSGAVGVPKFNGYQHGLRTTAITSKYSAISDRFQDKSGSLTGFSPWLRSCEVYFAISYAASPALNFNTPGFTQQTAYEKGVKLSLEENGISEADASAYMAAGGKFDGTLEQLFTQWWISVFKNGQEAWSLFRMSGYPQGNTVAPESYYPGHNTPPMAYGYPDSERNLNSANCSVESSAEVDYFWGKQMWWDVRSGLK